MDLKSFVTFGEEWPKQTIQFKDIMTLMDNEEAFYYSTDQIVRFARENEIDIVVDPEARGLIPFQKKESFLVSQSMLNMI